MELGSSGGLHLTKSSQWWRTWIDNIFVFKMVIERLNLFLVYAAVNTVAYLFNTKLSALDSFFYNPMCIEYVGQRGEQQREKNYEAVLRV